MTEVNAALFAQLHIYGTFNVPINQNTGEGPKKLGQRSVPTEFGLTNIPAITVNYSYKPQGLGTPGTAGNELYEALEPGVQVTTVVLDAIDGETDALVAADIADIYLMEAGVRSKGETGEGEFDQKQVMQQMIVVGGKAIAEDHALAAV